MPAFPFLHKVSNPLEVGGRTSVKAPVNVSEPVPVRKCPNCHRESPVDKLFAELNICSCGHHFSLRPEQRIQLLVDKGTYSSEFDDIICDDPLKFPGYKKKVAAIQNTSMAKEAVVCGRAAIGGVTCAIFVMDARFLMGSMGIATGERITRLFEMATEIKCPVVGFTVSGGARMQEGLFSLMQMAKTSAAVKRHSDAGLLYMTVLTNPTTGGVMASFAMEGDIILAEPGATAGFAGARVIEQTVRKKLPQGFQTAEFLLEHGFIDAIVNRYSQREVIASLLKIHVSH